VTIEFQRQPDILYRGQTCEQIEILEDVPMC
jgi:hypothetical protein